MRIPVSTMPSVIRLPGVLRNPVLSLLKQLMIFVFSSLGIHRFHHVQDSSRLPLSYRRHGSRHDEGNDQMA